MLKQKNVNDLETANKTHHLVGTDVQPEDLPTPEKSIQEIEHEESFQLKEKKNF